MIWARILVPFESSMTEEDVYTSGMFFCLENLKAGITSFADAGGPHMQAVAEAVLQTGLRASICMSSMDQGAFVPDVMKAVAAQVIARTERLYQAYHNKGDGRVQIWFGIRQALTSSPELMEATAARSRELQTGIHSHLAEHLDEVSYCLSHYKMRPAEWFDSFGMLGPNFIGAHSVRLSDSEVLLMRERNANVVHCPRSNLGSHGFSKTSLMLALGVNVGLGTDGGSSTRLDLFEQMRLLKSAIQARFGIEINDPVTIPTIELLRMATMGGARAMMLQDEIGTLETGKKADIVLLDLDALHLLPTADLMKTVVMSAGPDDVCDVIVNGRLILHERAFVDLDEERIRRQAGEALLRIGRKAGLKLNDPYVN
jgi:5-methylthioadenosine/S-adenosylhomocysteine deaminase